MTTVTEDVLDLRLDLEYQPGGIVSRVILENPAGRVTAFLFDAGQELSEHTCPYDASLHGIDGEGMVMIGGVRHAIAAGQIVKLPAHVPHAVRAERRFTMLLTMLRAANF